ncbi:hypothetical protein BD779DRAFT_1670007 [Infundibulicybe gibba]|nr:hypothetical protein BD779DRAFT_1670007 [Infundibulicybe gibba]
MEPGLSFFSDISGLPITVHHFHLEHHSQSAPRGSQKSNAFERGRSLVEVACSTSGWRYASKFPGTPRARRVAERSYMYFKPPPAAASMGRRKPVTELKEWGAPIDQNDDIFRLDQLEDFISTDITHLSSLEPVNQNKLDSSLHAVLPQPHFLPTKFHPPTSDPPPVPPYKRAKPISLLPSIAPFSPQPFSRYSWLVPIRGTLPWDHCTSAIVLESLSALPVPPDCKATNQLTWTRPCVCAFWTFLLTVRTVGTLGSIGVSFHAAPWVDSAGSYQQSLDGAQGYSEQRMHETETPLESAGDRYRSVLSGIDHIKVYHEAPNAMYLRNALDIWAYKVPKDAVGPDESKPQKIRMLRGARLVLIDERSKGILNSFTTGHDRNDKLGCLATASIAILSFHYEQISTLPFTITGGVVLIIALVLKQRTDRDLNVQL